MRVLRSAGGAGSMPSTSSLAPMKRSMGLRDWLGFETAGERGSIGWKDQCFSCSVLSPARARGASPTSTASPRAIGPAVCLVGFMGHRSGGGQDVEGEAWVGLLNHC